MKRIDEKIDKYLNESTIIDTIHVLSTKKQLDMKNMTPERSRAVSPLYDNMIDAVSALGDIELMLHTMSKTHGSDFELQKSLLFCKDKIREICKELIK